MVLTTIWALARLCPPAVPRLSLCTSRAFTVGANLPSFGTRVTIYGRNFGEEEEEEEATVRATGLPPFTTLPANASQYTATSAAPMPTLHLPLLVHEHSEEAIA